MKKYLLKLFILLFVSMPAMASEDWVLSFIAQKCIKSSAGNYGQLAKCLNDQASPYIQHSSKANSTGSPGADAMDSAITTVVRSVSVSALTRFNKCTDRDSTSYQEPTGSDLIDSTLFVGSAIAYPLPGAGNLGFFGCYAYNDGPVLLVSMVCRNPDDGVFIASVGNPAAVPLFGVVAGPRINVTGSGLQPLPGVLTDPGSTMASCTADAS